MPRSWKTAKRRRSGQEPDRGQVWQDVLDPDTYVIVHGIYSRPLLGVVGPYTIYCRDVIFVEDSVLCYQPVEAFKKDYRFTGNKTVVPLTDGQLVAGRYVV